MVAVTVTPAIRNQLRAADALAAVRATRAVETVPHKALCAALRRRAAATPDASTPVPTLRTLLRDAQVFPSHDDAVASLQPPARNPDVERRVAALRARLEEARYARAVADVSRGGGGSRSRARGGAGGSDAQRDDLNLSRLAPQMSLAFNVVVTMATCFVAGYFVLKHGTGSQTMGLIGGVVGLIGAMMVESLLLISKLYSVDEAARKHTDREHVLTRPTPRPAPDQDCMAQ